MFSNCAVITYNCAKQCQDTEAISLILNKVFATEPDPDYIAFCLQEVVSVIEACFGASDEWIEAFREAVPQKYTLIGKSICGACAVLVFSQGNENGSRRYYDSSAFGMLGSSLKGAAIFTIDRHPTQSKLSFVSAHLCANEGYKEYRNRDFKQMIADLGISSLKGHVFIGGDLNYRTADGTLETDELIEQMQLGNVGEGFIETNIDFKPTYKFHPSTNDYNDASRKPSFCDRILYRPLDYTVKSYNSVMSPLFNSDHKPVFLVLRTNASLSPSQSSGSQAAIPQDIQAVRPALPLNVNRNWIAKCHNYIANIAIGTTVGVVTTNKGRIGLGVVLLLAYIVL